jgi:hypothetical protein
MPLFESDAYRGIAKFQEKIFHHFMRTNYAKNLKKKKKKKKNSKQKRDKIFFSLLFERDRKRVQDLTLDAIANSTN